MEPLSTTSLSFFSVRNLVSASNAGAGEVVSLIVFTFSRVLAFKKMGLVSGVYGGSCRDIIDVLCGITYFLKKA